MFINEENAAAVLWRVLCSPVSYLTTWSGVYSSWSFISILVQHKHPCWSGSTRKPPHQCDTAPLHGDAASQGGVSAAPLLRADREGNRGKVAIWPFPVLRRKKSGFCWGIVEKPSPAEVFAGRGAAGGRASTRAGQTLFLTLKTFHHSSKKPVTSPAARCGRKKSW